MKKIIRRKRISRLLQGQEGKRFVYVYAPSGYGKTTAVVTYLKTRGDASICSIAGIHSEEKLLTKICRALHIERNEMSIWLPESSSKEIILFLDDVQYQEGGELETFLARMCDETILFTAIITSRQRPSSLITHRIMQERMTYITPSHLLFNDAEIAQLFATHHVPLLQYQLHRIQEQTRGWAAALNMLVMQMQQKNEIDFKQLDLLVDTAFLHDLEPQVLRFFCRLSIMKSFTAEQAYFVTRNADTSELLLTLEAENCFLKKDTEGTYTFAPVLRDALQRRLYSTSMHVKELYMRNALWYCTKADHFTAMQIYYQIQAFEEIMQLLEQDHDTMPNLLPTEITAVIMDIPPNMRIRYPKAYLKFLHTYIVQVNAQKGADYAERFVHLIKRKKQGAERDFLLGQTQLLKVILNYQNIETCGIMVLEAYQLMNGQLNSVYDSSVQRTYGSIEPMFSYYKAYGTLHSIVEEIANRSSVYDNLTRGGSYGLVEEMYCEYFLMIGEYNEALRYANAAVRKITATPERSVLLCVYYCEGRLALQMGDVALYHQVCSNLQNLKNEVQEIVFQDMCDIVAGHLYLLSGCHNSIAPWLWEGDIELQQGIYQHSLQACLLHARILFVRKEVNRFNSYCANLEEIIRPSDNTYAKLQLRLLRTLTLSSPFQIKALEELLEDCAKDQIIQLFAELRDVLYPILQQCDIHDAMYKKKLFRCMKQRPDSIIFREGTYDILSDKEKLIFQEMIQGTTRDAMAEMYGLSLNTIKYHIKNIYQKLNMHTRSELIAYWNEINVTM